MYLKNCKVNRRIFTLTVICALTVLPIYAAETSTNNEIQKAVIEMKMDNLSTQYLDEVEKLFYNQRDLQEYNTALKTVNYLINASIKYNGENHPQTAFAYIARARYYTELMIPNLAKKDLDKAFDISNYNNSNIDLKSNILTSYIGYYLALEEPYQAMKYIKEVINLEKESVSKYRELGQIYSKMKNLKEAEKYFSQYYDGIKDITNNEEELFNYHLMMAQMYQETKMLDLYRAEMNKAEEILNTIDKNKDELKILINTCKIQYFIDTKEFDKALSLLNENNDLISFAGKSYQKTNLIYHYLDFYREQKNENQFKKYASKTDKFYKTIPSESLLYLTLEEKQIDLNKDLNYFDKANEYANEALEKIETYKEFTPFIYGKYLRKLAEIKLSQGNTEETTILLDKALENYKKVAPESAYEFYEIYKNYAELSNQKGNYEDSINYYNKAAKIIKELQGDKSNDLVDIYSGLAQTYIKIGKIEEAIPLTNEAVLIKENVYGKTHIKTIEEKLNQYNIYKMAELQDEAQKVLNEINTIVDNDEVIGTNNEINFRLNIINAYVLIEKKEYESAIINAKEALKNAITKQNKQEAYHLLHQIYSKTNNKLKAYKYKKLFEKIEKE